MFTDSAIAYEVHAQEFLRARDASTIGSSVVEQWARTLPMGSEVIELGCGAGYLQPNRTFNVDARRAMPSAFLWGASVLSTLQAPATPEPTCCGFL